MSEGLDMKLHPIRYFADLCPGTGYNNATRGMVAALETIGYSPSTLRLIPALTADLHAQALDTVDALEPYMHGDWEGDDNNDRVNIVHLNPGMVGDYHTALEGRWNIAITTWETSQLPRVKAGDRTVLSDLNKFDEVWVPSRWVAAMFAHEGVTVPVHVVPHALRPELLKVPLLEEQGDGTTFYTMGAWNARKAPDALLQAYLSTGWSPASGTLLQLYCVPPTRDPSMVAAHSYFAQEGVRDIVESCPDRTSVAPYALHTTYVPYEQVLERHQQGHVFVTASRGEGFCLPVLEALAFGNWVIAGGPWVQDFADHVGTVDNSGPIESLSVREVPIKPVPDCRGYEMGQQWWEPSQNDLLHALKAAHESRCECGPVSLHARQGVARIIRRAYAPATVGAQIAKRLEVANEVLQGTGW